MMDKIIDRMPDWSATAILAALVLLVVWVPALFVGLVLAMSHCIGWKHKEAP